MRVVLLMLTACSLEAAIVQGVALDHGTRAPLARTLIDLIPVEGTPAQQVRLYTAEQPLFLKYRLTRLAAASGVVMDDNNVGMPDVGLLLRHAKTTPVVRIRPKLGELFTVQGRVLGNPGGKCSALTMMTETGRLELGVYGNRLDRQVPCQLIWPFGISWNGGTGTFLLRRMDLDGPREWRVVKTKDLVIPGDYAAQAIPADTQYYVDAMVVGYRFLRTRPDGVFSFTFDLDLADRFAFDRAMAFELKQFGAGTRELTMVNR